MAKSSQHLLDKNRKPRVHITYDVEIGGAKQKRDLPFVVGVMADLSGQPAKPLPRMANREFVEINADNFDDILAGAAPRLKLTVDDAVARQGTIDVEVTFNQLADFEPDRVAESIARDHQPLRDLLAERRALAELLNGMEGTPRFGNVLEEILSDTAKRSQLRGEIATESAPPRGESDGRD